MMPRAGILLLCGLAAACAGNPAYRTIQELQPAVTTADSTQPPPKATRGEAIAAYRRYLETLPADRQQRTEATRRLADLMQQQIDELEAEVAQPEVDTDAQRSVVIDLYQNLLLDAPANPRNPDILYQLARAHEANGEREAALEALTRLAINYPQFALLDEVHFRRGEILFTDREFKDAANAYESVLTTNEQSVYREQALYKRGWALFKLQDYAPALDMFTALLDGNTRNGVIDMAGLSRPQQERISDSLRVMALSFDFSGGVTRVPAYFGQKPRAYEHLVYRTLGQQYLEKERYTDAAETFEHFALHHPLEAEAPLLHLEAIEAYRSGGFVDLLLASKERLVTRYGMDQPFWKNRQRSDAPAVVKAVQENTQELTRHYHALAQKSRKPLDYGVAIGWYRRSLAWFPNVPGAAGDNLLLAELLQEAGRLPEAVAEYEHTAYDYPPHAKSADAAYAALLVYRTHGQTLRSELKVAWTAREQHSTRRFLKEFPGHPEAPVVLVRFAQELYAAGMTREAIVRANDLLVGYPRTPPANRRAAWLVLAHASFDEGDYLRAEQGYRETLKLTPAQDRDRPALVEKLAATVYKQAEQFLVAGDTRMAANEFLRAADVAPNTTIRPTAIYDAAAVLMQQEAWREAAGVLNRFRREYSAHPLQADVPQKLATAYLKDGQWEAASLEFATIAQKHADPAARREAAWQSAELLEKAGAPAKALTAWALYVKTHPQPVEPAIEARQHMLEIELARGRHTEANRMRREIIAADRKAGAAGTDRTRYLAATASMTLAEQSVADYRKIRLVEPLQRNLKRKQEALKKTMKELEAAGNYAIAEVATAATFQMAELYSEFSQALYQSARPKNLDADALEEYELLLEEQAFPFEEKAIEIHAANTRNTLNGIYDEWVRKSFTRLAKLMPARYAKEEQYADALSTLE